MIHSRVHQALILLGVVQINLVDAYWRLACSVSQEARIDPVVSPGTVSTHVHKFAGGINVGASSDGESLQTSRCSTCQVQDDKSAYWTPSLYYQHADGSFESVPNDGMTVYYIGRGGDASNTKPFPPGFSMISGNPRLRHYDTTALTYNNVRPIADRTHYINETNCVNGLRAQINFQSCWDGKNLYLANNSHVAYLSGIDYGVCPPTHPVPIPGLFFEVLYWVNDIKRQAGGKFVLANGDPTGFGFHADFINAWDQGVLTNAVRNCLYPDNGGVVSACPAFVPSNDVNFARNCLQAGSVLSEPVYGNLTSLPGCNPVTIDESVTPSCASSVASLSTARTTTVASTSSSSNILETATTTSSHPPLLITASLSLQVVTLTTFLTVTVPATRSTILLPSSETPSTAILSSTLSPIYPVRTAGVASS